MSKARQSLLSATNVVLTPESVTTYLAQMWITNIMQTVGWGLIGAISAKTSGRSTGFHLLMLNYQHLYSLELSATEKKVKGKWIQ